LVSVWALGNIYTLDLDSGARQSYVTYSHNDGPVASYDWSPDRSVIAYSRASPGAEAFHMVHNGQDVVIATVPGGSAGIGQSRVEFSPSGRYIAMGSTGATGGGETAAVQVRTLDGRLVHWSPGGAAIIWAGIGDVLYYDDGAGVARWTAEQSLPTKVLRYPWTMPSASADRRLIAFTQVQYVEVMDTSSGAIKTASEPGWPAAAFVTRHSLHFTQSRLCPASPYPCGPSSQYWWDVDDDVLSESLIQHVFATWPAATPTWT
jgi:Tol biopolymer transport system component